MLARKKILPLTPSLAYAIVLGVLEDAYSLSTEFGTLRGKKAVSCLVRPEPGDQVLLAYDEAGGCRILAVLDRADPEQPTNLAVQGDVRLTAENGRLTLASSERIELASQEFSLHAERGQVTTQELTVTSGVLESRLGTMRTAAKLCEQTFKELRQRLGACMRFVSGHEEVQTGSTRHLVEQTLTVQCKNSIHTAEETVKIDGETIHLA
jgi:hypothetical protein